MKNKYFNWIAFLGYNIYMAITWCTVEIFNYLFKAEVNYWNALTCVALYGLCMAEEEIRTRE